MTEGKPELQRNMVAEARRKELESYQRALDIQWLNNRMEDGRMGRCLALIRREAEMEKDFQQRTDHAAIVNARAEKEAALGTEVAKVRREEACALLRRHYLRERDPGLRELARRLQAGYVCRDTRQQILHNQYRKLQEEAQERQANAALQNAIYTDREANEFQEKLKQEASAAHCRDLQQQLVNRELKRQCEYEESLIEKKMLEDVMRTISDEDQSEVHKKHELMLKLRSEMESSFAARAAWRRKQTELVRREETEREEQLKMLSDRSAAIVAERERKVRVKEEINKRICDKIISDEAARLEKLNLITLLQEQEYLEKNCNDDIAEKDKMERVKKDTKEALTAQMETRKRLEREQKEREAEFRRHVEEEQVKDNEKERQKEMQKKEKAKQYARALQEQIQQNAARRRTDQEIEDRRVQRVWEHDQNWKEEVQEERKKIIEEHAPNLIGYLQAGVLKPQDLSVVRAGANRDQELAKMDIESMATSKRPFRHSKCNAQCRVLREY